MFEILVGLLQLATLITIFISLILLFIFRIIIVLLNKYNLNKSLLIIFIPFSMGYYYLVSKNERKKFYDILLIILFGLALFGIMFTLYQHFINGY